jgi:hypothetical protein
MPRRPQFPFLLRASLLLIAMLALWGAVLLDPLRAGLRAFTVAAVWLIPGDGSAAEAEILPNGDWALRLPMPAAVARQEPVQQMFGRASKDAAPVKVRSVKLVIEGKYPVLFTAGLPFYWALILASGWTWRRGRLLLQGSGVLFAIAVGSLVFYAIRTAIKNVHLVTGGTAGFLLDCGEYFVINVVPYLTPLVLALYLDSDLRALIFNRETTESRDAGPRKGGKKLRARH